MRSPLALFLALLLLCSCATSPDPSAFGPATELPADVTLNKDAARSSLIIVNVRLETGEELPFIVDTGAEGLLLDKSLGPKLGKRLRTWTVWHFGVAQETSLYAAPTLYLGNTRLLTGRYAATADLKSMLPPDLDRPILGILGIDCLQHYRIQLDFAANRMRFLDTNQVHPAELGQSFPLMPPGDNQRTRNFACPFIQHGGLIGDKGDYLMIDTGCNIDGFLESPLFQREVREPTRASTAINRTAADPVGPHGKAFFPQTVWHSATYTNLVVQELPMEGAGLIGLRFLARHLVTFDFPNHTMYLKQTSVGPLAGDLFVKIMDDALRAPAEFLESLRTKGRLPGWSKGETPKLDCVYHPEGDPNTETFNFLKTGDPSIYHYTTHRASAGKPWQLQKAWRSDQTGRIVEVFPRSQP